MLPTGNFSAPQLNIPWISILAGILALVGAIGLGFLIWKLILRILRVSGRDKSALDTVMFEVRVPPDNEYEIPVAEQMFASIYSIYKGGWYNKIARRQDFVSFEIVGLPESIRFYVVCPKKIGTMIEKLIHGSYPTAEITAVKEYNIFNERGYVEYAQVGLAKENYYPVRTYEELQTDGISSITSALSKMGKGEGGALQMVISPTSGDWAKGGKTFVTGVKQAERSEEGPKITAPEEVVQKVDKKISKVGFNAVFRVVVSSPDKKRAKAHVNNILSVFGQYNTPRMNRFKKKSIRFWERRQLMHEFLYRYTGITGKESVLNTEELATIFHYPNKNVQTPHINWLKAKRAPAAEEVPTEGIWLGKAVYRGEERDVFISDEDRMRHMYIIGQTGTGKSWALQIQAMQDIQKGNGIAFIDPHGDAAEWLLDRIPPERVDDVIYWDPADTERPFGFNILEFEREEDKHMIVSAFYGMLEKLYDPNKMGITGPILERAIRNSMLTAMSKPGNTMIEVQRLLLLEDAFIEEMKKYIKDDLVLKYWTEEMAKTTDYHKSERVGYFASKLDRFITDNTMRGMLGQSKSAFNLREVMDSGKILIVNLAKGSFGAENSQFLGLLLVPRILSAAMSRVNVPIEQRRPFYLYVDEFQNFATDKFAEILSEARKYQLSLNVANQYIGQMIQEIKDAVFGNVGTLMCFRVGPEDGEYLETHFSPTFTKQDLTNIDNQHAYLKLLVEGKYPPPFSIRTTYSPPKGNPEISKVIRELSRMRYGKDRRQVDAEIRKRGEVSPEARAKLGSTGIGGSPIGMM